MGIAYGMLLLIIQLVFDVPENKMNHILLISGAVIIAAAVSVNIIYHVYYERKMFKLTALFEEGNIDTYISEMEKLEKKLGKTKLRDRKSVV